MAGDSEFRDFVLDQLEPLGGVTARSMFGGAGLYRDGTMFAIVSDDVLYLKVDDETRPAFEDRGMAPLTYERRGRSDPIALSYWEAPPDLLEDADDLCAWAARAWKAARRARDGETKKRSKTAAKGRKAART